MKTVRTLFPAVFVLPLAFPSIHAEDYVTTLSDGAVNWGDAAIWTPATVPNFAADRAFLNGSATVLLADECGKDASFTVRALDMKFNGGGKGTGTNLDNVEGVTGVLNFDNGPEPADLVSDKGATLSEYQCRNRRAQ